MIKHYKKIRQKLKIVGVVFLSIILIIALFYFARSGRMNYDQTFYESYNSAKRIRKIQMYISPRAEDICYRGELIGSFIANFRISETDFLAWAKQKGWKLKNITEQEEVVKLNNLSSRPIPYFSHSVTIRVGYYYKEGDLFNGGVIRTAFDKSKGFGYFSFLTN